MQPLMLQCGQFYQHWTFPHLEKRWRLTLKAFLYSSTSLLVVEQSDWSALKVTGRRFIPCFNKGPSLFQAFFRCLQYGRTHCSFCRLKMRCATFLNINEIIYIFCDLSEPWLDVQRGAAPQRCVGLDAIIISHSFNKFRTNPRRSGLVAPRFLNNESMMIIIVILAVRLRCWESCDMSTVCSPTWAVLTLAVRRTQRAVVNKSVCLVSVGCMLLCWLLIKVNVTKLNSSSNNWKN